MKTLRIHCTISVTVEYSATASPSRLLSKQDEQILVDSIARKCTKMSSQAHRWISEINTAKTVQHIPLPVPAFNIAKPAPDPYQMQKQFKTYFYFCRTAYDLHVTTRIISSLRFFENKPCTPPQHHELTLEFAWNCINGKHMFNILFRFLGEWTNLQKPICLNQAVAVAIVRAINNKTPQNTERERGRT